MAIKNSRFKVHKNLGHSKLHDKIKFFKGKGILLALRAQEAGKSECRFVKVSPITPRHGNPNYQFDFTWGQEYTTARTDCTRQKIHT
ncbi:hypothetical protein DESC_700177 [Desulfosarcina cetonica]|nr:hypothetical protein DESC_700177 [Desulfosarcina cetonica]